MFSLTGISSNFRKQTLILSEPYLYTSVSKTREHLIGFSGTISVLEQGKGWVLSEPEERGTDAEQPRETLLPTPKAIHQALSSPARPCPYGPPVSVSWMLLCNKPPIMLLPGPEEVSGTGGGCA